jgi:hypothetical protein
VALPQHAVAVAAAAAMPCSPHLTIPPRRSQPTAPAAGAPHQGANLADEAEARSTEAALLNKLGNRFSGLQLRGEVRPDPHTVIYIYIYIYIYTPMDLGRVA